MMISLLVTLLCASASALLHRSNPGQFLSERMDFCSERFRFGRSWPFCPEAPWRPSTSKKASATELCVEGKSLPKLYVLGAQKTSTSSFANDLACAGVSPVPSRSGNEKEFSFFVARFRWEGAASERAGWLQALPNCSSDGSRLIADLTPNNLRMVHGENTYGKSIAINLPSTIKTFYGEHRKSITLVAMIREPLSRMQSAWYAARQCGNHAICTQDCKGESFQADLKTALGHALYGNPPLYTEWLWTSMYGRHLQEWLLSFNPKQFYVIPYKQYANGNADAICRSLSERLAFDMDCESNGRRPSHSWKSEHPSLSEEMTPRLTASFKKAMDGETDRLVTLLSQGHQEGMGLANYHGSKGSEKEIRSWLEEWW